MCSQWDSLEVLASLMYHTREYPFASAPIITPEKKKVTFDIHKPVEIGHFSSIGLSFAKLQTIFVHFICAWHVRTPGGSPTPLNTHCISVFWCRMVNGHGLLQIVTWSISLAGLTMHYKTMFRCHRNWKLTEVLYVVHGGLQNHASPPISFSYKLPCFFS